VEVRFCGKDGKKLVLGLNVSTEPMQHGPRYENILGLIYALPICDFHKSTCQEKAMKKLQSEVKNFPASESLKARRSVLLRVYVNFRPLRKCLKATAPVRYP
jgi:hypothetical protein